MAKATSAPAPRLRSIGGEVTFGTPLEPVAMPTETIEVTIDALEAEMDIDTLEAEVKIETIVSSGARAMVPVLRVCWAMLCGIATGALFPILFLAGVALPIAFFPGLISETAFLTAAGATAFMGVLAAMSSMRARRLERGFAFKLVLLAALLWGAALAWTIRVWAPLPAPLRDLHAAIEPLQRGFEPMVATAAVEVLLALLCAIHLGGRSRR
jgi:hypothetical protein